MSNGIPISALVNAAHHQGSLEHPQTLTQYTRDYYVWRNRVYPYPRDDDEAERLDIMHELIYQAAMNNQLHAAQLPDDCDDLQILDVGSGTGKWADDVAKRYPHAEVMGIDILPCSIFNPNLNFEDISPTDFTDDNWGRLQENSLDLAHLSQLCGSVPDWERMYRTVFRYLKPGVGQIETIEIDWTPRANPSPFPPEGSEMHRWWECMKVASERAGFPLAYREDTEELLENAGFVDISRRKIRIPFYGNPKDPYEKRISEWYRTAMGHAESPDRKNAFAGMSLMLLTGQLGMKESAVRDLCTKVTNAINKRATPLHNYLYIWTARKPRR